MARRKHSTNTPTHTGACELLSDRGVTMCIKTVQRRRVAHTVQVRAQAMATGGVTALITGANRGLGLEMVKQMAECEKGAARKVFACCRDPDGAGAKVRESGRRQE